MKLARLGVLLSSIVLIVEADSRIQDAPIPPVHPGGGGYLLDGGPTDLKLNLSDHLDAKLFELLRLKGPDMRQMRDFRDPSEVTVDIAKRAWSLMRQHALAAVASRILPLKPLVEGVLVSANVSQECQKAAQQTLESAKRLESWAIKCKLDTFSPCEGSQATAINYSCSSVLNAWGSFPSVGLFEGTYSDIGSYHGCVDIPDNEVIGHAHYCTIAYRPVLPTRDDYELIVNKEPSDLLGLCDNSSIGSDAKDAFGSLLGSAQYNHYVYYKLGTCFPIECSPYDVQRLARLLGRQSILMSGPVKCHSSRANDYEQVSGNESSENAVALHISTRDLNNGLYIWKPHITASQWTALVVVSCLLSFIIALTLIDIVFNRLSRCRSILKHWSRRTEGELQPSVVGADQTCPAELKMRDDFTEPDPNNNNPNAPDDCLKKFSNDFLFSLEQFKRGDDEELKLSKQVEQAAMSGPGRGGGGEEEEEEGKDILAKSRLLIIASECSIITNLIQFLNPEESQARNDIACLNGLRSITMCWIIITHTMQYNDWSAFARTREIETHLKSLINQPLFNGSYLVDTFFLVSGLLTSYSSFRAGGGGGGGGLSGGSREAASRRFFSSAYLIGRYLRLTPQVVFVSLLFILLPLAKPSGGPHWYTITGEYSENCAQNWWLNLFYIQAFYRSNEMCNFVCWWISVDMFYHLFALALILLALRRPKLVAGACAGVALAHAIPQALIHFKLGLPPNLLSTIPQTGAMWSQMTLELFWTPYAHAAPFFLGFYLGFLMARRSSRLAAWFNRKRALLGWTLASLGLALQSYSTYFWVVGKWHYTRLLATSFFLISPLVWSSCLAWIILACQYGHGGPVSRLLSCKLFIILGKASYVVYLSHFLVLFTFFGSQNLLLEPTQLVMLYVMIGNICLSMLLGSLLSIVFEMPWLKAQRWLMRCFR